MPLAHSSRSAALTDALTQLEPGSVVYLYQTYTRSGGAGRWHWTREGSYTALSLEEYGLVDYRRGVKCVRWERVVL